MPTELYGYGTVPVQLWPVPSSRRPGLPYFYGMKYMPLPRIYMKFGTILFGLAMLAATGCNNTHPPHEFYHYSMWSALVNKAFDGDLTVKEARTKGDIGLGTYNGIDGELILFDGVLYQALSTGEIRLADDTLHIPYLNATFFEKDLSFTLNSQLNYDSLRKSVQAHFPSRNFFLRL